MSSLRVMRGCRQIWGRESKSNFSWRRHAKFFCESNELEWKPAPDGVLRSFEFRANARCLYFIGNKLSKLNQLINYKLSHPGWRLRVGRAGHLPPPARREALWVGV